MRTFLWIMAIILSTLSFSSYATESSKNFPSELLYKGQPIDTLCFDPMETANSKTDLATCGIQSEPNEKITKSDPAMLAKGYTGYDYDWTDEQGKSQSHGYSYYKAFKNRDNSFTIYTVSSGGGSGQFSSLILAKRHGDTLELKSIAGGDRCNSGIFDVKQEGNALTYKVNMTPYDFLGMSKQNSRHLAAYTDLEACAACCIGSATVTRKTTANSNEKIIAYNLDSNADALNHDEGKYQNCFNRLVVDAKKRGEDTMKPQQLNAFIQKFNAQCV